MGAQAKPEQIERADLVIQGAPYGNAERLQRRFDRNLVLEVVQCQGYRQAGCHCLSQSIVQIRGDRRRAQILLHGDA
jgi:hypothetical protein